MNATNLDLDAVRALVAANDLGNYGQAAARLGRTPSAVSLQMKRLQQQVGATLFRREGRTVALTEAGQIALRYGRRLLAINDEMLDTIRGAALSGTVRIGLSQDFAEAVLPGVLARFTAVYPLVMVEVRIEGNAALVEATEKGQLDIALTIGHADRPAAQRLGELDLTWIAREGFRRRPDQPLPLVVLGPQCAFRKEAILQLDRAHCAWRVAATSPSLTGLWAAAIGGLGVTARTRLGLPASLVCDREMFNLPPLPAFPVTLHTRPGGGGDAIERLRAFIAEAAAEALASTRGAKADAHTREGNAPRSRK
jgi:DNA-binding transcriptional LysR family regulator